MKTKRGYRVAELGELARRTDLKADDNVLSVMDGESDCTSWRYPYYAVTPSCRYVMGFDDDGECSAYCGENMYVKLTLAQACQAHYKPNRYDNWTATYPTGGLLR